MAVTVSRVQWFFPSKNLYTEVTVTVSFYSKYLISFFKSQGWPRSAVHPSGRHSRQYSLLRRDRRGDSRRETCLVSGVECPSVTAQDPTPAGDAAADLLATRFRSHKTSPREEGNLPISPFLKYKIVIAQCLLHYKTPCETA